MGLSRILTGIGIGVTASIIAATPAQAQWDDPAVVGEFQATLDRVLAPHGLHAVVVTEWLEPDVYARAEPGVVILNKRFATSRATFEYFAYRDIEEGFHPPGCNAIDTIAIHEAAHMIEWADGFAASEEVERRHGYGENLPPDSLSGYSWLLPGYVLNIPEALAEAFVSVHCEAAPSPVEYEFNHILVTT